jgi:transcriptional regulator
LYAAAHFKEDRVEILHRAIREAGLATLVTHTSAGLVATHLPLLLDADAGPNGTLLGHVARANPHWRAAVDGDALATFLGPNAYVTPSWYATKRETGKVVPTWNYVAVHAYGPVRFFDDPDRLLALVTRLTEAHEAGRAPPWAVSDAPPDFVRAMVKGIVGVELPIARLEGIRKLSQNRPAEDRAGVVAGLAAEGPAAAAVAALVAEADAERR